MIPRLLSLVLPVITVLALKAQQEPPRLRTVLPNGATLLVENIPTAKVASVQLFASSLRVPDNSDNHGYKHILEHLVLKGQNKDLDFRMESQGIFFTGETLRDAMQARFVCAPDQVPAVIDALSEIMSPLHASQQDIKNEIPILRQEHYLQSDPQRLGQAAWTIAYGDRGVDPFGNLDMMAGSTPEKLQAFQSQLFAANNLVLVIDGPLDIESISKLGRDFLSRYAPETFQEPEPRPAGKPGRQEISDAFGEARAARVGGFRDPETAWALAAALAIASDLKSVFVTYTPSADNGLVIVGHTDATSGLGLLVDSLQPGDIAALFPIGKVLARRWVLRQMSSPTQNAFLRGLLLCQGPDYKPEELLANIDSMTWQEFQKGVQLFGQSQADIVVGVR